MRGLGGDGAQARRATPGWVDAGLPPLDWNPPRLSEEEMDGLTDEEKQYLLTIEQTLVEGEKMQYEDILRRFGRSEKKFTRQFEILRDDWERTKGSLDRDLKASLPESSEYFVRCYSKVLNDITSYKLDRMAKHFINNWGPNSDACSRSLHYYFRCANASPPPPPRILPSVLARLSSAGGTARSLGQ